MADYATWYAFIKSLRADQDQLRAELEPYKSGKMRVGKAPLGVPMQDCTQERIAEIEEEIASIQRTIDAVIAEQGLRDA